METGVNKMNISLKLIKTAIYFSFISIIFLFFSGCGDSDNNDNANKNSGELGCWIFIGEFANITGEPENICAAFEGSEFSRIPGKMEFIEKNGDLLKIKLQPLTEDPADVEGTLKGTTFSITDTDMILDAVTLNVNITGEVTNEGEKMKITGTWDVIAIGSDGQFTCNGLGTFNAEKESNDPCIF